MNALLRRVVAPAVVGAAVLVAAAGVAHGWYTAVAGTGTGTATPLGTTSTLTLTVTGTAGAGLYPGGPGADVTFTVANPYPYPVVVSGVAGAGPVSATPLAGRTCVTHGVTLAAPTSGLPVTVPASSSAPVTLAGVATMGTSAESGCQGATFAIPLRVVGRLS